MSLWRAVLDRVWSGSLRARLVIAVAGVHAVMMTAFVVDFVRRQERFLTETSERRATGLAEAVAASSPSWVLARDSEGLGEVVGGVTKAPGVLEAMVLSPELRVLAHSDPRRVGSYLSDARGRGPAAAGGGARVLGERDGTIDAAAPVVTTYGRVLGWARVRVSTADNSAAMATARRDGVAYALIATLVGMAFALGLAHGVTRDLRRLAGTADHVRRGSAVRSQVVRSDELGRLATGFNAMLDALEDQRRSEATVRDELAGAEVRLDRALTAANQALWEYSATDGMITLWARGTSRLGLPGEHERAGVPRALADWKDTVHPDDRARVEAEVERVVRADESELTGSLRLKRADGAFVWFDVRAAVLRGAAGEVERIAGSLVDATEAHRRDEDQAALERQLLQARKMEALGHLAGGVAHDFNNMLTAILAHAELARDAATDPGVREDVEAIIAAAGRASGVAGQVLAFSRGRAVEPAAIDLGAIVTEVQRLVRPRLGAVTLTVDAPAGQAWTLGERSGLVQVVLNLCLNACDALRGSGHIGVSLATGRVAGTCASCHEELADEFCEVCVSDDGPGIAEDVLPRIFEPFFTTRPGRGGSGLGLAVVHGLAHGWGGHLLVERDGGTTRFRVLLRAALPPAPVGSPTPPAPALPAPPRRLVLVDDEPSVGLSLARVLRRRGWDVVFERSASAALARCAQGGIDAVLTDYAMPGMNGLELARALKESGLEAPIVLMTGNPADVPPGADVVAVVSKPPDLDGLARLLGAHLGSPLTR